MYTPLPILLIIVVLLGASVFYMLLPSITHPHAQVKIKRTITTITTWLAITFAKINRSWKLSTRYGTQLGGYVHDDHTTFFIPPTLFNAVTGTWADAAGVVSHTYAKKATIADNTATVTIPIAPIGNTLGNSTTLPKGFYLTSIDIWWEVTTAALDALSATIYRATLPANGAAFSAPSTLTFTYDTAHDTAAERLTLDQHKMTLTLSTPIWLSSEDLVTIELSIDGAATSVVYLHGARANGTLRL